MTNPNVLDVLRYIFDVVLDEARPDELASNHIEAALTDAGFEQPLIDNAMDWLMDLADAPELHAPSSALRIFSEQECARLDGECRDLLLYLDHQGILSATNRERVIERLMALDNAQISATEAQWVALMVLYADRAAENEFAALEGLVFDPGGDCLH